jgi:hypothetical protein
VGSTRRGVGRRLPARAISRVPCDAASASGVGALPPDAGHLAHMKPVMREPDTMRSEEHLIGGGGWWAVGAGRCSGRDGAGAVGGRLLGCLQEHSGECGAGGGGGESARYQAADSSEEEISGAAASGGSQKEIHVPGVRSAGEGGRIDGRGLLLRPL